VRRNDETPPDEENKEPSLHSHAQAQAKAGALHRLGGGTGAYFEDAGHFAAMRALTSFTHPALAGWEPGGGPDGRGGPAADPASPPPRFPDLKTLEAALLAARGLRFCSICLAGRKVFVSEQVAYTKAGLAAHAATGDADGPLADSSFAGHPACRFCRGARFYGESELYTHMQTAHEHCFLCRRARPAEHVYYRDYADLARHFTSAHHACVEPACLERRFVVFGTAAELGRHVATEHGDGLSKAARRAALTIEIDVPRYGGGTGGGPGGGSRGGGGGPGGRSTGLGGSAAALRAARAAGSRGDLADGAPQQQQRAPAPAPPPRPPSPPRPEDFPAALGAAAGPSSSTAGRATAAGVLAARQAGVIRSARWAAAAGGARSGGGGGAALAPDEFPALGGGSKKAGKKAAKAGGSGGGAGAGPSSSSSSSVSRPVFPGLAGVRAALPSGGGSGGGTGGEAFPALGGPPSAARAGPAVPPPPPVRRVAMATEFPSLGVANGSGRRGGAGGGSAGGAPSSSSSSAAPPPVSPSLAAANKALLARVRGRLSEVDLASFREQAARYARREGPPSAYFSALARLGLGGLAPEMASLLPDPSLRAGLMDAWAAAARSAAPGRPGWAAPEAVAAARARPAAWACDRCGGLNGPADKKCAAVGGCGGGGGGGSGGEPHPAAQQQQQQQQQQPAPQQAASGRKKKGVSLQLSGRDPAAAAALLGGRAGGSGAGGDPHGGVRPGNAWTQPQRRRDLLK
jgi:E3 ubiquitin-protein ligase ZNF598